MQLLCIDPYIISFYFDRFIKTRIIFTLQKDNVLSLLAWPDQLLVNDLLFVWFGDFITRYVTYK